MCPKCKKDKDQTEFGVKGKNKKQPYCINCNKEYKRKWYKENKSHVLNKLKLRRIELKQFVLNYLKDKKCSDCGENDPIVLEFDHIKGNKQFNISEATHAGRSLESIKKEIQKCVIRCANCHRKKTAKQQESFKWLSSNGPIV